MLATRVRVVLSTRPERTPDKLGIAPLPSRNTAPRHTLEPSRRLRILADDYDSAVASQLAIAALSMTLLTLILNRWKQGGFLDFYKGHPKLLPYVFVTLVFLPASALIGVFGYASRVPQLLAVEVWGLLWGLMFVVIPPLVDLQNALAEQVGERPILICQAVVLVIFIVGSGVASFFILPWWTILAILIVSVVKTSVQLRYQSARQRASAAR
jgi:hypothetical protein